MKQEEKKDYIINLRISRKTCDKLKQKAKENGQTLSSLIRKTVNDGLDIMGDVSDELLGKEKKNKTAYHHIVVANKDLKCTGCDKTIDKNTTIFTNGATGEHRENLCGSCVLKK